MNFKKILEGNIDKSEIFQIMEMDWQDFQKILEVTRELTDKNFGKKIKIYVPGKKFPAISITGSECSLNCAHCNQHYLKSMIDGSTPDLLYDECIKLDKQEAVGCLISGGFNENFHLPFENYFDTLKRIKKETNLILNVHTGLITPDLVKKLEATEIDIVSFDLVGSNAAIKNVYGLEKTVADYESTFKELMNSSIKYISPHICIGLNYGKPSGEIDALNIIKNLNPYLIVLLGLRSTPETPISSISVDPKYMVKIIAITRLMFPRTEISLGCMRPIGQDRKQIDLGAFHSGVTRIEIPTYATLEEAEKLEYKIQRMECCCSIPETLEKKFLS
ncbi:MAG: radical SAM protein [Candidatus Lokiarchaeota archaeon]|nr:radical SAM protein [Candidatus Lokiarchaeota archaeon]